MSGLPSYASTNFYISDDGRRIVTDKPHNNSTYSNHGCRCDECTAAHTTYYAEKRN